MEHRHIEAGERFVFQGEEDDKAFIIQHGSCLAIVEKEGELHPANHFGVGDIVGGLGILLVRSVMDRVAYRRETGRNIVTLLKHLGDSSTDVDEARTETDK